MRAFPSLASPGHLRALLDALGAGLLGREHVLPIGPPGSQKSAPARRVRGKRQVIDDANRFGPDLHDEDAAPVGP